MKIFAQLGRFAGIGITATVIHVLTAIILQGQVGASAQASNLGGFFVAFGFSYAGHALITFKVCRHHATHMRRFFIVSVLGLVLSASITHALHDMFGVQFWLTMLVVAICVPGMTFFASKYWVFSKHTELL